MNDGMKGDSIQGHLAGGLGSPCHPTSCSSPFSLLWPGQLGLCVPTPQGAGCFEHSLTPAHVQDSGRGWEKRGPADAGLGVSDKVRLCFPEAPTSLAVPGPSPDNMEWADPCDHAPKELTFPRSHPPYYHPH